MKTNQKIVFMGTPDFAAHILNDLVDKNHNVVGVITTPDKPAGRGYKIQQSAVKKVALKHELTLLQPEKLKDEDFIQSLQALEADVFVVIAFRMLPKVVWNMPKHGTFNLHASLLPQYRGAAPIHWAVVNGETETGVTTFFIDEKIDTGEIIANKTCKIEENDTVGKLHDKLMLIGSDLVHETLLDIESGNVKPIPQEQLVTKHQLELKEAPKLFKSNCHLNFNLPTKEVYNKIRGLNPFPGAWAKLTTENEKSKQLKCYECRFELVDHNLEIGQFIFENKEVKIACLDGYILLDQIQLEGKKRMKALDFARGFNFDKTYLLK